LKYCFQVFAILFKNKVKLAYWILAVSVVPVLSLFQNCAGNMHSTVDQLKSSSEATTGLASDVQEPMSIGFETSFEKPVQVNQPIISFVSDINLNKKKPVFECKLNQDEWSTCQSPLKTKILNDGNHTFFIRAKDANQKILTDKSISFSIDTVKPVVSVANPPSAINSLPDLSLIFQSSDQGSGVDKVLCSIDNKVFAQCLSPISLNKLVEGDHSLKLKSVDKAGNESDVLTFNWKTDFSIPTVTFTTSNSGFSVSNSQNIEFIGANKNGGSLVFECSLDQSVFSTCKSPFVANSLPDGTHTLKVKITNAVGQTNQSIFEWKIDRTLPLVKVDSSPAKLMRNNQGTFGFTAKDSLSGIAKIECKLDSEAYKICLSPVSISNLTEGTHNFFVRSFDQAGNMSTEVKSSFTVDLTAPTLELTGAPSNNAASVTLTVSRSKDNISSNPIVTYALNGGQAQRYLTPVNYSNLPDGNYTVDFKSEDEAGNVATKQVKWMVDRTAPAKVSNILVNTQNVNPKITWDLSTDGLSGVSYYEISVGQTNGAVDLLTWFKPSLDSKINSYDLNLSSFSFVSNEYFVNIRAVDLMGNISEIQSVGPIKMPAAFNGMVDLFFTGSNLCATFSSGEFKCNGYLNNVGLTAVDKKVILKSEHVSPVLIDLIGVKKASFGNTFGCAVMSNNGVKCWGSSNSAGQLGNGTYKAAVIPVADILSDAKDVQVAGAHACALLNTGRVKCWGYNGEGGVGQYNNNAYQLTNTTPYDIGVTSVKSIAIGPTQSCSLHEDSSVECWNYNGTGQTTYPNNSIAPTNMNLNGVVKLAAGTLSVCALMNTGTVKCWSHLNSDPGPNKLFGVLGTGNQAESLTPVNVVNLNQVIDIAASASSMHTCALLSNATVKCWGVGASGQMGNGANVKANFSPVLANITDVSKIYVASSGTCAFKKDNSLFCWGSNYGGFMGVSYSVTAGISSPKDVGLTK